MAWWKEEDKGVGIQSYTGVERGRGPRRHCCQSRSTTEMIRPLGDGGGRFENKVTDSLSPRQEAAHHAP